jgi:hypothetical protein
MRLSFSHKKLAQKTLHRKNSLDLFDPKFSSQNSAASGNRRRYDRAGMRGG